jgi:hypothetical protein
VFEGISVDETGKQHFLDASVGRERERGRERASERAREREREVEIFNNQPHSAKYRSL